MSAVIDKVLACFPDSLQVLIGGQGLKARVARGSLWIGAGSSVEQGLRFARNIFLAHLLAPEAFGVLAIILAFHIFFEALTDISVETSILQNPSAEEQTFLNGVWFLSVGRSVVLYILALIVAPWVAWFYENPAITPLMWVAFLSIPFNGLKSPRAYIAHKKLDFRRSVSINQGGAICGILTACALAFVMQDVWSLVIGFTVESAARTLLSHLICPFRPGLTFERKHLQSLFSYTKRTIGLPILAFAFAQADIFVIGKLLPPAELGIYSMALSLAQIPFSFLGLCLGQLANPVFSEMQTDLARMRRTLTQLTTIIAFLIFPLVLFVIFYGRDLLQICYGSAYAEAAVPMALLFGASVLRLINVPITSLYFMIGRPEHNRSCSAVRTIVMLAMIYPATELYGLTGAAFASLIAMSAGYLIQVLWLRKSIGINFREYCYILLQAAAMSLVVAVIWLMTTHNAFPRNPWLNLMIGVVSCLVVYALAIAFVVPRKIVRV